MSWIKSEPNFLRESDIEFEFIKITNYALKEKRNEETIKRKYPVSPK